MNSYPPELLTQLAPLMFVAGLDSPAPTSPAGTPTKPLDTFSQLTGRLRDALATQRKVAIWQPEKNKTFNIVLVDREVRFPPRKLYPPDGQAHSPLSPLAPSSPLHPDGIIAPIWIRKHTALVPAVFVLFTRLFELPPTTPRSPLDTTYDPEREQEERKRDTELAADISARKKTATERGIKLTVVLIASRRLLDDPALDNRLTFIRRTSGLDARASLFVLSPVSAGELEEFVKSLQEALYEPAVEYYTNHSKRVRRKRNRHAQTAASHVPLPPMGLTTGTSRPLRPEGWAVRYEYKMACFAEFRGEDEVALKHYQDAYQTLSNMFGSTSVLPPRTKRWAEAKVLIDSISIKILKLYLYNNEHALALAQHTSHLRRFSDFSRGWGIGEETFEYWAWIARQYRVLAELIEQGIRSTLVLPSHAPISAPPVVAVAATVATNAQAAVPSGILEPDAIRAIGVNPSTALQHPGFYYYLGARATEQRRAKLLAAMEGEAGAASAPSFSNERKVDHLTIILELFTRAYELFKKHNPAAGGAQGRLTLWIAYRIGQVYFESGKFDMAARFFERIARTYRREKWETVLRPLLTTWYRCAQQMGDVDLSVRLLVEMIAHGFAEEDDLDSTADDLVAVLKSSVPSNTDGPLIVDLTDSEPIFDSTVVFWRSEVLIGETAAFQVTLALPPSISLLPLPITSLAIYATPEDETPLIVLKHSPTEVTTPTSSVALLDLGHITLDQTREVEADLRWNAGSLMVLAGKMSSDSVRVLKLKKVVLTIREGSWWIQIPQESSSHRLGSTPASRWLSSLNPPRFIPVDVNPSATIQRPPHHLEVTVSHDEPAYLDEEYPILLEVTNMDAQDLEIVINVLLQPSEVENAVNVIRINDEESASLIRGITLGTLSPGAKISKQLSLVSSGGAGDRILDVSVLSRPPSFGDEESQSDAEDTTSLETSEVLRTLIVPTKAPFSVVQDVKYRRSLRPPAAPTDLRAFNDDWWDDGDGGEAHIRTMFECQGPWGIQVESVKLLRQDSKFAKVIDAFVDIFEEDLTGDWLMGDQFSDSCKISLAPGESHDYEAVPIMGPGVYELAWRRILKKAEVGPLSTSKITLPTLQPPSDGLIALLHAPTLARLHVPIELSMTVRNRHPTRSATPIVQVDCDPSDGFVLAGMRSGRLPVLLPGSEHTMHWNIVPIECGYVHLPKITVTDRRKPFVGQQAPTGPEAEILGQTVRIVDVRWDAQDPSDGPPALVRRASGDSVETDEVDELREVGTVLVLPT